MSFAELLKAQGLTDEQIKALTDTMAEEKVFVTEGEDPAAKIADLQKKVETKPAPEPPTPSASTSLPPASVDEKDAEILKLQQMIARTKVEGQIVQALMKENATDPEYLMYQLEKAGTLDKIIATENGKLEGAAEAIEGLKTNFSTQFSTPSQVLPADAKRYEEKRLEGSGTGELKGTLSLEEAVAQHYAAKEN